MLKFGSVVEVKKNAVSVLNDAGQWVSADLCLVNVVDTELPEWHGMNIVRCENGRPVGEVNWRAMSVGHNRKLWKSYSRK